MKREHLKSQIQEVESDLQAGKTRSAGQTLSKVVNHKVPRKFALKVAELSRRSNLALLALKVLNPIVRAKRVRPGPTPAEIVEYAASLLRLGAIQESQSLLGSQVQEKIPVGKLYAAFGFFARWEYAKAIPLLESYIKEPELSDYERAVGKLNLAAALVNQWDPKVRYFLEELLEEFQRQEYHRLYGNTLELCGQFYILGKDIEQADKYLGRAHEFLASVGGLEHFFVKKWQAISSAMKSRENLNDIRAIRKSAVEMRHWESVRDCDLFLGVLSDDPELLHRVYFGSPYDGFRQRMFWIYGRPFEVPNTYQWQLGAKVSRQGLNYAAGLDHVGQALFARGQAVHRLLGAMVSDFYRPFRLAQLFAELYPGEFFNPVSSPGRVHQVIKRLKLALKESPVQINEAQSTYSVGSREPYFIQVERDQRVATPETLLLDEFREKWSQPEFRREDLSRILDISPRKAQRLLKKAKEEQQVESEGSGVAIRYRFSA